MGLNDIQLTPALVHQLYCNSLVDINIINQKDTIPVPHLGKNEKQVLILVNEPGFAYLPDAGLLKLTEILNACLLRCSHCKYKFITGKKLPGIK